VKKIAITQRLVTNDSYFEVRECLDINYSKLISACGYMPIVLPYEVEFKYYFENIDIEGVLLTGGNDLNSCSQNDLSQKRDTFEKKLLTYCIKNKIPVFGICRGMQVIAEFFGSSFKRIENQVNIRHDLQVNQSAIYKDCLKLLETVNSYHNFSIDNIGDNLIVSATDTNGIIKAIEHKNIKIFAQMWHSEREKNFNQSELNLIKKFFSFDIEGVIDIAKNAGDAIMKVYHKELDIEYKDDKSPVTQADLIANEVIVNGLSKISSYPVVTEESQVSYSVRKNWNKYWLVDPLDGTKDFIAKNGEFTVNIALIENHKPVMGVVYAPVTDDIYYAEKDRGAFKNKKQIFNNSTRINLIGSDSNFHSTDMTKYFFKKNKIQEVKRYGSSLKICKLAEGEIDVYPRLNGTKEWDTAASHIIANEAGCKLVDVQTRQELTYNKKSMKNNHFIASKNNLEFET
jgi:3'(2'),5'-bisphosphate nucleotidase